jgi:hypothetical protein
LTNGFQGREYKYNCMVYLLYILDKFIFIDGMYSTLEPKKSDHQTEIGETIYFLQLFFTLIV